MKVTTKRITYTALLAALICVVSPFSIPIGVIPLSLCSLAVYISSALIDKKSGTVAVLVYVMLGAFGVPVFSGFAGGPERVIGPTGGYIIGYIFCALVSGIIIDRFEKRIWAYPVGFFAGTAVLYVLGTAWYMIQAKSGLIEALLLCVVPFLIGDLIKIVVASLLCFKLRFLLKKQLNITPKEEKQNPSFEHKTEEKVSDDKTEPHVR